MKKLVELVNLGVSLSPQRLVVVGAEDEVVIEAVLDAMRSGIINPILLGDEENIRNILLKMDLNEAGFKIIHTEDLKTAAKLAVTMVRENEADFIMKGLIDTNLLLKEVVNSETGIKDSKLLSHVSLMSYPRLDRLIFITDSAMNIEPNVDKKIKIIENALDLTKKLGFERPKVGLVSAVEKVNPKIKSTVDAREIVDYYKKKKRQDLIIDGPFAIDNLISKEAKEHKGITSEVAGDCDVLVFPDLVSGNVFYKTSIFLAGAISASIIIGASCPIVLTSRADSSKVKYYSILLGMIYNNGKNNISN